MRATVGSSLIVLLLCFCNLSFAQLVWQKDDSNPAIPVWLGNDVDDPSGYKYAIAPSVVYETDKQQFHMWFTSLAFGFGTSFCISEAISQDGSEWYIKARNPVLRPGPQSFDSWSVNYGQVIQTPTGYKMFYSGWDNQRYQIGLATSPDGKTWTKQPGPVLPGGVSGSWNYSIRQSAVVFDGSLYQMWFEGFDGVSERAIGYATSSDGTTWTPYPGNPILTKGAPGSFEEGGVGEPAVVKVGSRYHMILTGYNNSVRGRIGYAYSDSGTTWTKYPANPVLNPDPSSWDAIHVSSGSIVFHEGKFHAWYNGTMPAGSPHQIGHAVSDSMIVTVRDETPMPGSFSLRQSYPNPFNPSTNISFSVPSEGNVSIKVYDVLGREITTISSGVRSAGEYSETWNGRDSKGLEVGSGTYFARLEFVDLYSMSLTRTMKMTLIR